MDRRTALCNDDILEFAGKSGGNYTYTIEREIGRGGSCIVYEAAYETNSGDRKLVRVKECYPYDLEITRLDSGELCAEEDRKKFEECKGKFIEEFKLENKLFYTDSLNDLLVNTLDIFSANNTVYMISSYLKDKALSEYRPSTLKSCINIVKNAASAIAKIHTEGYLYLDTKPENILVVDSASERVLLFDLDTLIPISEIGVNSRPSYSRGYAAPELRTGRIRRIGCHTDVYGIGAVLFYLLFGRTPTPPDCESSAEYDFSGMNYSDAEYCDKLYFGLRNFFRKTLANYYPDRFKSMNEAVTALEEIKKYSDIIEPYIISTKINRPVFTIGRELELVQLGEEYQNTDRNYIFVSGMGGIGKTTLVKEFICRRRDEFDAVLYLNYGGSLMHLIADDNSVRLNTVSKISEESIEDYYLRKLNVLKKVSEGKNFVAVFDNFDGFSDPHLKDILGIFRKVIFVTRADVSHFGYYSINISAISETEKLHLLFEHNIRRSIKNEEFHFVDNIISKTASHTLALELIAKQISNSLMSLETASDMIDKLGITHISSDKMEFMRDDIYYNNTPQKILTELLAVNKLSESHIALLKIVALFGANGIDAKLLQRLCRLNSPAPLNRLIECGWVFSENGCVFLHTVICETVEGLKLSESDLHAANLVMKGLCAELEHGDNDYYLFKLAESVLRRTAPALKGKNYAKLGYRTLKKAPVDVREDLLGYAKFLSKETRCLTPIEILDMYVMIIDLYEAGFNYTGAEMALENMWQFAKKEHNNYIMAKYFDMSADFYNKRYGDGDVDRSLKCSSKAIFFAHHSRDKHARELLASCALFKAVVMMRNFRGSDSDIYMLLRVGKDICEKEVEKYSEVYYEMYMTRAFYSVFIDRDPDRVEEYLRCAYEIIDKLFASDYATVVHIILPAARMYYDLLDMVKNTELLKNGLELCRRHDELPYKRLEEEILEVLGNGGHHS